ncbi:MAG TPA: hypothetical protein VFI22_13990, partial [Thermomicrobiales bacterium]|nr:hypothetical protein [Thermomicrobiales bacterium]
MRRPSALLVLALSLALAVAGVASVHPGRAAARAATPLGTEIPVINADGAATGTVAVTDVADPFTGFDPTQPPEADKHYVALTVVFDANAGKKLDVDPSALVVQDAAGNLWSPTYLPLPDSAPVPQLTGQALGPGSRISGLLGYVAPDGATLARVWYRPDSDHLFPIADLSAPAPPVVGQQVSIADSNGATGGVTVTA